MTDDVVFLRPGHPPMRKAQFAEGARAQQSGNAPTFAGNSEKEGGKWKIARDANMLAGE